MAKIRPYIRGIPLHLVTRTAAVRLRPFPVLPLSKLADLHSRKSSMGHQHLLEASRRKTCCDPTPVGIGLQRTAGPLLEKSSTTDGSSRSTTATSSPPTSLLHPMGPSLEKSFAAIVDPRTAVEFHNNSSATLRLGGNQEPFQIRPHLGVPQEGYFVWDRNDFGYHQLQFDNHVF